MVTVLLAACNGERYLAELLTSLQSQTLSGFQVLWQDDGSRDATAELLRAVADARFAPGSCQGQHLGPCGNFLSLMAQCDTPYTALCDQDDVWHADKLACLLAALQQAEARYGADTPLLVHSDCRLINGDGAVTHSSFFRHQGWNPAATILPPLLVQNNVTGCTLMMNAPLRRLVVAHARAGELFMHDWFIALTAAAFGQIVFVDEPLTDYRQHGSNVLGASRSGLLRRSLQALRSPERARERIALTYRHARMVQEAFGSDLPDSAARVIDAYLATEQLPRLKRIRALHRGGYLMQSPLTRLGQMIF